MAFKKVTLSPEEEAALQGGGNFFKFSGIGSKMLGRFVKSQPQTGQYAKKDREDYVFRVAAKDEHGQVIAGKTEEVTVNATKKLHAQLQKAHLKPGWPVKITLIAEIEIGMPNKMPEYDVEFDDSAPAGKPAAPPPPPPPADDDIPF